MVFLHLSAAPRQAPSLSPRLQRAVQLLQMPSTDFAALVRAAMEENPFLESEDDLAEPVAGMRGLPVAEPDRDPWVAARAGAGGTDSSAMDLAASEISLAMHLHGQLNVMALSPRDLLLARAIVESLEDDGYLRTPLAEIAALPPLRPRPGSGEMRVALRLVQSLDPAGVAARSLDECLLLQCQGIPDPCLRTLAGSMLTEHLEALAARDIPRLAQALDAPADRIVAALDGMRRLDPHPGWRVGSTQVDYLVPDVIVQRQACGGWNTQLNPAVMPRVRLHTMYEHLFKQDHACAGANPQLSEQLQEARWTLRNMEQRFSTILAVARAIIGRQGLFLEYGAMAMKPLVLGEIAEEVGVHESTVSRATRHKYMATPLGVFELKHFFSRPLLSASGAPFSATAARELIGSIIASEVPGQPLSDAQIAGLLAAQGLRIARRTVTKYRQMLRIAPVEQRAQAR